MIVINQTPTLLTIDEDVVIYKEPDPYYGVDPITHPRPFNYRIAYTTDTPVEGSTFEYPYDVEGVLEDQFTTWYHKVMKKEPI